MEWLRRLTWPVHRQRRPCLSTQVAIIQILINVFLTAVSCLPFTAVCLAYRPAVIRRKCLFNFHYGHPVHAEPGNFPFSINHKLQVGLEFCNKKISFGSEIYIHIKICISIQYQLFTFPADFYYLFSCLVFPDIPVEQGLINVHHCLQYGLELLFLSGQ